MLSISIGMAIVVAVLSLLPTVFVLRGALLDVLMLIVIVFPIMYFLSFKPLQSYNSELHKTQTMLKESEERYRSLVESTEDSIYLVDKDFRYLFINTQHQSRMGFSGDEYTGKPYSNFHTAHETDEFTRKINEVFMTGKSVQQEHKSKRDGKYFLRTFSPVRAPDGTIEAVTVVSKNIDSVKQTESKFH